MDEFFAYIDEAGDEGFGKLKSEDCGGQSHWLMLGAILVSKENDRLLPKWRDEVLITLSRKNAKRDLHFVNLKHDQRVAACKTLAEKKFGICVICSDKTQIPKLATSNPELYKKYKSNGYLYNYLVRFCLERLTSACIHKSNGQSSKLNITFSKRHSTNYQAMRDYLYLMRDGKEVVKPVRSINWNVLNPEDIHVENHSNRAGLQIADVVTSAVYKGFESNKFGDVETRYADLFKNRFLKENGRVENCGLTLVPKNANPSNDSKNLIANLNRN